MNLFWGKEDFELIETIWYKENQPVWPTNTNDATHYHLCTVTTTDEKQMSRKMKAPSRQGPCRPVQIVQQGVKSDKEADQTSRTCPGEEQFSERERRGKRAVKTKRWRKHATRSSKARQEIAHYIKIWFAPYGSDGFVVIGHDLCAQEPDDLQATSPRHAHIYNIWLRELIGGQWPHCWHSRRWY